MTDSVRSSAHPEQTAAALPLLFHNQQAQVDHDPQVLAARLAQHYPLTDFGPRRGYEQQFSHRSTSLQVGSLLMTTGYTTPIEGQIGEMKGVMAVNLCLAGGISYENQQRNLAIHAARPLYFSAEAEYRYATDHFHGLVFHLDLERLKATAAAIGGLGVSERRFAADLEAPRVVGGDSGRNRALLRTLRRILTVLNEPELEGRGCLDALQIDDLIYRSLALLACPRLEAILEAQRQGSAAPRERIFEDLLEWLQANLHRPVSLSELERRCGYSRRTLQVVFQQRFGCGPMQWVRQQRLEQARQALLQAQPGETVAAVASRLGFSSLAVFSRDFRGHFGLRPSELLREGRRQHP